MPSLNQVFGEKLIIWELDVYARFEMVCLLSSFWSVLIWSVPTLILFFENFDKLKSGMSNKINNLWLC